MKKLYTLTTTDDTEKENLYVKKIKTNKNNLDFITYFNSFSLKKWKQYTTLQSVTLKLQFTGQWKIVWKVVNEEGEKNLLEEFCQETLYEKTFVKNLEETILGFELTPLTKNSQFQFGAWYGTFSKWKEKKIGIAICTFKRENYVRRTISVLREFQKQHSWLSVLVVDNGSTLKEVEQDNFRIIHNPNYGGSGGFTRGMLEYVEQGKVDYVLLMDDDIVLDPTVLERTYSLLCGLRDEYKDSFLAGAMLRMEEPTIQHENTACWGKIRLHAFGKGFDLSQKVYLIKNEKVLPFQNRYAAWWYCCIPLTRISQIGYPLPVFVRGDDIEYGIRNNRKVIHMNGIGVWHQSFQTKISPVIRYYDSRNMLILNNYAQGCGFVTFLVAIWGHAIKRIFNKDFIGLKALYYALCDYNKGFYALTQMPLDQKMENVMQVMQTKTSGKVRMPLFKQLIKSIYFYSKIKNNYQSFRKEKLQDSFFWKTYLSKGR